MKIGVLHIILSPGGGAWSVVRELATWQKSVMPVAVGISYRPSQASYALSEAEQIGIPLFHHRVVFEFPNSSALFLPPLLEWHNMLKKQDENTNWVTHFHNGSGIGFAFWPSFGSSSRYPLPSINTFHGIAPEDVVAELRRKIGSIQTAINGYLARKMNQMGIQITTLSYASRAELVRSYKLPEESIKVVYNGVPAALKKGCPRLHGINSKMPFTVGFVGNIGKKKRWDIALDAVSKLRSEGNDICLLIAGSGPEVEHLKQAIRPFTAFVKYLGSVAKAGSIIMPLLDVLVLPAHHEGQPVVILEAMACGVPSIATAVGAIPETIEHGKNGYLIKSVSSFELADRLKYLMDRPGVHSLMSKYCIDKWLERFSVSAMGQSYNEVYESLLSSQNNPL
jgi:glycosyltransferase involved in cell wall biosynthesis